MGEICPKMSCLPDALLSSSAWVGGGCVASASKSQPLPQFVTFWFCFIDSEPCGLGGGELLWVNALDCKFLIECGSVCLLCIFFPFHFPECTHEFHGLGTNFYSECSNTPALWSGLRSALSSLFSAVASRLLGGTVSGLPCVLDRLVAVSEAMLETLPG